MVIEFVKPLQKNAIYIKVIIDRVKLQRAGIALLNCSIKCGRHL